MILQNLAIRMAFREGKVPDEVGDWVVRKAASWIS